MAAFVPSIAVVVVYGRRPFFLGETLCSIALDDSPPDEILLVGAAEPEPGPGRLRYRWIASDEKYWGRLAALGVEVATSDVIAFLDDDDLWVPGKTAALRAAFSIPGLRGFMHGSELKRELDAAEPLWERRRGEGFYPNASCMALRRDALVPVLSSLKQITARGDEFLRAVCAIGPTGSTMVAPYQILTRIRIHSGNSSRPLAALADEPLTRAIWLLTDLAWRRKRSDRVIQRMLRANGLGRYPAVVYP